VPPGEGWTVPAFGGEVRDGFLYGRGAADMKGAVAAFAAASAAFIQARGTDTASWRISLILTGDEEGPCINGTKKIMDRLAELHAVPQACVLGEPTCAEHFGETVKTGRRGSLNARITVRGVQGHVAYPDLADNPVHRLIAALAELAARRLDEGGDGFLPSSLAVTSVDVGNPAGNVIPARAEARLNVRFGPAQTARGLADWIEAVLTRHAPDHRTTFEFSAEPFFTPPGPLVDLVGRAVADVTGTVPECGTAGGTSDARFIKDHCPVVEFGPVGKTMHKADERVAVPDLVALAQVYRRILERFFAP